MRRKKVTYPPPKTATSSRGGATNADARAAAAAERAVTINLQAMTGRADIVQGSRVRIMSGLYSGEIAVVESVVGGVIPAALVRTEAGRSRRVRTVDLVLDAGGGNGNASAGGASAEPAAGASSEPAEA
ncbi:MAG TPA: hypothetical protein VM451_05070 [Candidatus Limnocylindria bacterium]|nr:hypothetical protein [Candidatus Limnocylindria bacterium]